MYLEPILKEHAKKRQDDFTMTASLPTFLLHAGYMLFVV
jgi:hypothetical protein